MEEVFFRCATILHSAGQTQLAEHTLADARGRVERYAESLAHPGWRKRYLAKRPVRELANLQFAADIPHK